MIKKRQFSEKHKQALKLAHPRLTGQKSPHWKGGKPKCIDCGKERDYRKKKTGYCRTCFYKHNIGTENPSWKHGKGMDNTYWSHIRRNRENQTIGSHTESERLALKIKYGYICLCCMRNELEIVLTKDHIIPITRGGTDFIENIQPLCKSCNSRKYTKILKFQEING